MTVTKSLVEDVVKGLPENVDLDDLMYRLSAYVEHPGFSRG